jgi:PAS domain S-box-containing protein
MFRNPSQQIRFSYIQTAAEELNKTISDSYGDTLTGKIFRQAFEETAKRFKEFECFPQLVSLLPNETLGREHLHLLNQTQIEQIFLEKLAEVEKLNEALHKQIEETKKAEDLVRKNEATLSSIISSTLDAIITIDRQGHILRWNPAATETFGYKEKEVIGKKLYQFIIPKRYQKPALEDFGNFLLEHESKILNRRLELNVIRKDGLEIPAEFSITTVTHNYEIFFHGFFRDISDRKKREQEILMMKEKAEQAVVAKSEFLSVMSHEIRTPLNAVIGFSHLLLDNNPRADQVEYLNILKFSGENLLNLVNDILDFSKLDSGKAELEAYTFSLRLLTDNLLKSFLPKADEKSISLSVTYDPRLPETIKGDSVRIGQVLNNLFSNALKFTDSGAVSLNIKVIDETDKYYTTHFVVSDTGIGIPKEKQQKIFELFTQADGSTGRKYGGTGLGLNIAQKIIALMGGNLEVKSEPGQGSEFHFTVPLMKAEPVAVQEISIHTPESDQLQLKDIRVLLAEDHKANSFLAKQFLQKWGAIVVIAENGREALNYIANAEVDIVLMDLQMPVMDGFECASIIRSSHPHLPILALTASRSNEIEAQAYASGMNDFVGKPFKPKELKAKILQHLQMAQ